MRTFVEIVDRGSLTAAAESLDRSQPAVVRSLAALESHLGVQLLRRTTRRMSLTPEGQDYLERCRRILADVEDAESAVNQQDAVPRGQVRMTGPVEFGRLHLVPAVSAFLSRHEQVRLELLLLDRNVDLVSEGIDLALRIGELADSSLLALPVAEIRRVTVASPSLLALAGVPEHPQELASLPCIRQHNIPRIGSHWAFADGRKKFSVPVEGRLGVNQVAAAVAACAHGVGFGQFLSYQVQEQISQGTLRVVLEKYETRPRPVNLVYPGRKPLPTRVRALIKELKTSVPRRLEPA